MWRLCCPSAALPYLASLMRVCVPPHVAGATRTIVSPVAGLNSRALFPSRATKRSPPIANHSKGMCATFDCAPVAIRFSPNRAIESVEKQARRHPCLSLPSPHPFLNTLLFRRHVGGRKRFGDRGQGHVVCSPAGTFLSRSAAPRPAPSLPLRVCPVVCAFWPALP